MQASRDISSRFAITMSKFQRRRLSMTNWKQDKIKTKKLVTPCILKRVTTSEKPPELEIEDDFLMVSNILRATGPPTKSSQGESFRFFTEVETKEVTPKLQKSSFKARKENSLSLFQEWKDICNDIGISSKTQRGAKFRKLNSFTQKKSEPDLDVTQTVLPKPGVRVSVLQKYEGSAQMTPINSPVSGRITSTPGENIFENEGIRLKSSRASRASTNHSARYRSSSDHSSKLSSSQKSRQRNRPVRLRLNEKGVTLRLEGTRKPVSTKSSGKHAISTASIHSEETSTLEGLSKSLIEKYSDPSTFPTLSNSLRKTRGRRSILEGSLLWED